MFSREQLSERECHVFGEECVRLPQPGAWFRGAPADANEWMAAAVARTDGRSRVRMFDAWTGAGDGGGVDQKEWVERRTAKESFETRDGVSVAVVNGAEEPFINIKWIASGVNWGPGLWRGQCWEVANAYVIDFHDCALFSTRLTMDDSGHCAFWERWDDFNQLLTRWLLDHRHVGSE